ncbi:hypothetical protein [Actinomycetospora flava]|uniref:DUF2029 domain-containing protein n=1 Tax=Actinomycetospora flava TaxID=3129232 RepID=A0ABU8M477_9PSEU
MRQDPRLPAATLGVLLAVISWHTAWNLGGPATAVGYALAATAVLVLVVPRMADTLPAAVLPVLVGGCAVALAAAFVAGVPAAYGDALGAGSDRADALNVALSQLAQSRYPYTATTYLDNPITPLPGALLLAAPFWWVTGNAGWQNLAWLLLLLPVLHGGRRLRPGPTVLWALVAVGGLEVIREFVVGDDLVTGAVPALAATVLTLRAARGRSAWGLAGAAILLGVATCTRPHMVLVVVVVAAAVGLSVGARRAAVVGAGALLVWAALVVPFLLGGITRFSPLHTVAKVTGDRAITAGIVVVALGTLALLLLALRALRPSSPEAVGWACAAVLFAPSVLSLARRLLGGPAADVDLTLGAAAVPFAVWAVASRLLPPSPRPTVPTAQEVDEKVLPAPH